jgi:hypothetical protein
MNFSFSCAHDMIDLEGSLMYQFANAFLSDMMNDLVKVVSSPPNETIVASYDIRNFRRSDSP